MLRSLSQPARIPMTAAEIARMSAADRIAEAMRRALPLLPADARSVVETMLKPESLALITGTLVLWAGSHLLITLCGPASSKWPRPPTHPPAC